MIRQPQQKTIARIITTMKILFVIFTFMYQGGLLFFPSLIIILAIFILEVIAIALRKHKKRSLLITVLLFLVIIPIMSAGLELGPTLGTDIRFNNFLWKQSTNNAIRYFMANSIIKMLKENNYSEDEIVELLGKPDFGRGGYFLRNSNLFFGLGVYILLIEYDEDNRFANASVGNFD